MELVLGAIVTAFARASSGESIHETLGVTVGSFATKGAEDEEKNSSPFLRIVGGKAPGSFPVCKGDPPGILHSACGFLRAGCILWRLRPRQNRRILNRMMHRRNPSAPRERRGLDVAAAAQYFGLMARVEANIRADLGRKSLHPVNRNSLLEWLRNAAPQRQPSRD